MKFWTLEVIEHISFHYPSNAPPPTSRLIEMHNMLDCMIITSGIPTNLSGHVWALYEREGDIYLHDHQIRTPPRFYRQWDDFEDNAPKTIREFISANKRQMYQYFADEWKLDKRSVITYDQIKSYIIEHQQTDKSMRNGCKINLHRWRSEVDISTYPKYTFREFVDLPLPNATDTAERQMRKDIIARLNTLNIDQLRSVQEHISDQYSEDPSI